MIKYINADRLIRRLENRTYKAVPNFIKMINEQEAADVQEVRHGRWKCVSIGRYACSLCGCEPWYEGSINTMHYCPNCGAKMDEVTE